MYTQYAYEDSLVHFGIPGMKWGVRRFQNSDGTLTAEGRRRYGIDYNKRGTKSFIVDQEGNKMKRRDRKFMEKQMIKSLKKDNTKESRQKLAEYKRAKKLSNTSMGYVGNSQTLAMSVLAFNAATSGTRQQGKDAVNKMLAEYANSYLSDLDKSSKQSSKTIADVKKKYPNSVVVGHEQPKSSSIKNYNEIYKKTGVNMNSEDPDDYREAEYIYSTKKNKR